MVRDGAEFLTLKETPQCASSPKSKSNSSSSYNPEVQKSDYNMTTLKTNTAAALRRKLKPNNFLGLLAISFAVIRHHR